MAPREYRPWGHAAPSVHTTVVPVVWRSEPPALADVPGSVLPFAYGRSYGDSCLNAGGALLDVAPLNRFIAFDEQRGVLRCEAGLTLAEILVLVVPRGWFLPVVPGTQQVSVGGALANDIHGKNHHRAGTFGAHVTRFELLRSSGERLLCSPSNHPVLFRATIGGLGLTGLILWAEIQLKRIPGAAIALERIRFRGLDEFFELCAADRDFEYTVAWIDCLRRREPLGRGVFMRGDHARTPRAPGHMSTVQLPFNPPRPMLSRLTMSAFNALYYWGQLAHTVRRTVRYEPFFFPLDAIGNWNRLYGPAGLVQYQCVVPDGVTRTVLEQVRRSGEACYLAVLKKFGAIQSPGLLSFPRPGVTLAMDFTFRGEATLRLLERLDGIVAEAGGAVYPAKDVRMSGESFRTFFPQWEAFAVHVDPKFSSSFWRRVTAR
ncbi:MAG: FAD-binding oxidoreductase [Gemmatimonadales bacterium]